MPVRLLHRVEVRRLISVAVLCVLGCGGEVRERGIVVLSDAPVDSLDARFALSAAGQRVTQLISPGLVTFDAHGEPVGDLAESITQIDALTLEFKLRENLRFHDGSSLTAADIVATFDGLLDPSLGSPRAARLAAVERVEEVAPDRVRLRLKKPYAPILADLSIGIVPKARARLPQDQAPIGAGPFRFVSRPDEDTVVLEPHPGYHRGAPAISRLVIRTVRDETTRSLELMKGRADLVVNSTSPANVEALRRSGMVELQITPGTAYAYMALNLRGGPTADVRVRRALCLAIDPGELVRFKLRGLGSPATGMLPPDSWAYAPARGCKRDVAMAKRLLDEAGYPEHADGSPRLVLSYKTSTDRLRRSIAVVLQKQALEAGIGLDIRALEFGTFFTDIRRGNFQVMTLKWVAVLEPDLLRGVFSSKAIPSEQNNWGGWNRGGFRDAEVDAWLDEALEAPKDRRRELYAKVQARLDQELPYLPLWHEDSVCVVSRRLQGYACSPHGFLTPLAAAREVAR